MGIHDRCRIYFRVKEFDGHKGVIVDNQNYEYRINAKSLAPGCGHIEVGNVVSGFCKDFETVEDLLGPDLNGSSDSVAVRILRIECPEKKDVASYVEHLANSGQLRHVPGSVSRPYAVEGLIIQDGLYWSVVLVPAGERLDRDRPDMESAGPAPDVRGWAPRGTPHDALNGGRPDTGDTRIAPIWRRYFP